MEMSTFDKSIFPDRARTKKIDLSKVDVSMDGIELEDREFIAAIREKREPNSSLAQVLPCMQVLGKLESIVDRQRKATPRFLLPRCVFPRSARYT